MLNSNSRNDGKSKKFGSHLAGIQGSHIGGSRFASRMKSSALRKFGSAKSRYIRQGSSQYSVVRENGDPVIWRLGKDVTPLTLQSEENTDTSNYDIQRERENFVNDNFSCFIAPDEPILHYSGNTKITESDQPTSNANDNSNNNAISVTNNNNENNENNIIQGGSAKQTARSQLKAMIIKPGDSILDQIVNQTLFEHSLLEKNKNEIDKKHDIFLTETNTKYILQLPCLSVFDSEESKQLKEDVLKSNKIYEESILQHNNSDLFSNAYTQTFSIHSKNRSIQAAPCDTKDQSTQSSKWKINDSMKSSSPEKGINNNNSKNNIKNNNNQTLNKQTFVESTAFKTMLEHMECAIIQNVMSQEQMLYRTHASNWRDNQDEFDSDDEETDGAVSQMEIRMNSQVSIENPDENGTAVGGVTDKNNSQNMTSNEITNDNKNINDNEDDKTDTSPHLQLLWKFESTVDKTSSSHSSLLSNNNSNISKNKSSLLSAATSCSCIDINHKNKDLIASGYGECEFGNNYSGLIKFWTLKNPTNPIRIYNTSSSVCSINFSKIHPSLLAAGLFDGNVSVFDIRTPSLEPILKSDLLGDNSSRDGGGVSNQSGLDTGSSQSGRNKNNQSKHNRAVWNVMWENVSYSQKNNNNNINTKQQDSNNNNNNNNNSNNHYGRHSLFSISSDGNVKQWSMKKGFQSTAIMSLKRVPNLAAPRGSGIDSNTNTIRSRQASGLCFEFPDCDNNIQYYVGTEDGIVHKCSVSYNEQVLRTYYGHTAPVYSIKCNPFDYDKFLTCSSDWTIKIWDQSISSPLIDLQSNNTPVNDIQWSNFNSCIFASATRNGKIELWDLETNKKDPIISHNITNINNNNNNNNNTKTIPQVKCVKFVPNSPSILAGLDNGSICVYRINNVKTNINSSQLHQMARLFRSLQKNS